MSSHTNLEIKGTLRAHSLAELFAEIARAKLNGSLRISNAAQKTVVYFDAGEAVFAASNARRLRLFELLGSENKISSALLAAIPDFTNDLALRENLIKSNLLSKTETDALVSKQIGLILKDAFEWRGETCGEWIFSPLVRVKGDIRFAVDAATLLLEHARNLTDEVIASKFKDSRESFSTRTSMPVHINLLPEEAFVFSRFEAAPLNPEEAAMFSGLPVAAALKIVYTLWLAGFLARAAWNAPFSERSLEAISGANLTLKKSTEAGVICETKKETPVASVDAKINLPVEKEIPAHEELTLEKYLERIETAQNFYEFFAVAADVPFADIKRVYLSLAKRFHPDLFRREIDADKLRRIQTAFTRIAQAYETLKNEKPRELYDYKMRKELAENKFAETDASAGAEERGAQIRAAQAAEDFENGFNFLMDENPADALPYLARAAHLAPDNARYRAYYGKALSTDFGQKHKAEAEMQAAVRIEPENADYRMMLAEFFLSMNLPKRAEGELNRLLSISPNNIEAKLMLDNLANRQ